MLKRLFRSKKTQSISSSKPPDINDSGLKYADALALQISEQQSFLCQLLDDGLATQNGQDVIITWPDVYRVMESGVYPEYQEILCLPLPATVRPVLNQSGTFSDGSEFDIRLMGWEDGQGRSLKANPQIIGGLFRYGGSDALLSGSAWKLLDALREFHGMAAESRDPVANQRLWAKLRHFASDAGAKLNHFLQHTVILTPERLRIDLRKGSGGVIEVIPGFDDAPLQWLEQHFDQRDDVPDSYAVSTGEGLTVILVSEEARTVLREIKKLKHRRVAGERAEAFVRNPFAVLGPDASKVIDGEQFEQARDKAGLGFSRFTARVLRDKSGVPIELAILVEESLHGLIQVDEIVFATPGQAESFIAKMEARLSEGKQCCPWEGYELEILGDTVDQLILLRDALRELENASAYSAAEVFDISRYSERCSGFGKQQAFYSPFITRKSDDSSWFPENIEFGLCFTTNQGQDTVAIVLNEETLQAFRGEVEKAVAEQRTSFHFPGCPQEIPVEWAKGALETFAAASAKAATGKFNPQKDGEAKPLAQRLSLLLKPNIDAVDYSEPENRAAISTPAGGLPKPCLPSHMNPGVALKDHQLLGVSWLQHLWSKSPRHCRGALLADDMGLGKTLQLLTFLVAEREVHPDIDPFLVVAPVSLLENWKDEIEKFFAPDVLPCLTLYGKHLNALRVSREKLDEELRGAGVTKLLVPNWIGRAKLVLTTYETLRDLEFSLAMQKWSVMICDEAQKIKNPNALVTRAAKKQNVRFRIACTGTPVENTLTDLWCLFDFIQPGLLGALNDFGRKYRRPIEAETEEERIRIEELRKRIEPQILRRVKADVAKDLPAKIEVPECRTLKLSDRQRQHYANAVGLFRAKTDDALQSHLGLIQYLRRLCCDPRPLGAISALAEPVDEILRHSPKMAWLVRQLEGIRNNVDDPQKVIVFCEFRDLQRTLQRVIRESFGVVADIINGDTSTAVSQLQNRQGRIKAFQSQPGFGVIILSPLAVGFGVNIQAANHVVHFTRTWNPAKEDQATDRAYRIGQTRDVFVYYLSVIADDFVTFDKKLDDLLAWRRRLAGDMLNGTGDISPSHFGDLGSPDGGKAFGDDPVTAFEIEELDPVAFEAFCAVLWSKQGFAHTLRTPTVGDGGIDVVAIRGDGTGELVQCKSSSIADKELGWDAIKEVVAGSAAYAAKHAGVKFERVAVTNRRFNGTARDQAKINHVRLVEGDDLVKLLECYPVCRWEVAQFVVSTQ